MRLLSFTIAGLVVLLVLYRLVLRDLAVRGIESLFRRPGKPPRPPAPGHYYKRYWS